MEEVVGKLKRCLYSQEISRIFFNTRVHYHVHKSPQLDTVLRQYNTVYTLTSSSLSPISYYLHIYA
jgi:hypothetical protein